MSARTRAIRRKAARLFEWHGNYTFRQISESYRFWKKVIKRKEIKKILNSFWII